MLSTTKHFEELHNLIWNNNIISFTTDDAFYDNSDEKGIRFDATINGKTYLITLYEKSKTFSIDVLEED